MSLVPDYEDSDDESNLEDSSAESESPYPEIGEGHLQTHINKNDDGKKEILPSASFQFSGESKPGAVFNNPFKAAENAKIASLEKHVKMVNTDDKIKTINGKKICWNYRKGRCRFGSKCKFAHDSDIQITNDETKGQTEHEIGGTTNQATEIPVNRTHVTNDVELDSIKKKRNKRRPGLNTCNIPSKQVIKVYSGQT